MSHKQGAYLGGIRSIADMRERCHIDEDTGCWNWRGKFSSGTPRVFIATSLDVPALREKNVGSRTLTGPTAAYILSHGLRSVPKGRMAYRKCLNGHCVNPEHITAWTRIEHGAFMARSGKWKGQENRIAANTENKRKHAKLSLVKAREIRASCEPQQILAARYDVPQSTIWAVKAGKLWKDMAANASVFTWAGT